MLTTNLERMADKIEIFNKFGDTGNDRITRLSLSPEELEAREELCKRCRNLGMQIQTDDMANIYATLKGDLFDSSIITGSHLDSAKEEDSNETIGVLAALEAIETIVKEKIPHRHSITLVVWTNTKGARFYPPLMASGVICGKFEKSVMIDSIDSEGVTFKEALEASGYMGTIDNRVNSEKYIGFIEVAIEQGRDLEKEDIDMGIIEGSNDKKIFYPEFIQSIEKNIEKYGYTSTKIYSDCEYNSKFISDIIPTAMILVPRTKKIDFIEQCWKGANVLLQTILDIDKNH
nr:amidohydrolase [Clostridium neonatale]